MHVMIMTKRQSALWKAIKYCKALPPGREGGREGEGGGCGHVWKRVCGVQVCIVAAMSDKGRGMAPLATVYKDKTALDN